MRLVTWDAIAPIMTFTVILVFILCAWLNFTSCIKSTTNKAFFFVCLRDIFPNINHIEKQSDLHCNPNYHTADCLDTSTWRAWQFHMMYGSLSMFFFVHCKLLTTTHSSNTNDFTWQINNCLDLIMLQSLHTWFIYPYHWGLTEIWWQNFCHNTTQFDAGRAAFIIPRCSELRVLMMTSSNGNVFRVTAPLCRKFTSDRRIPHAKASDAELLCFFWSVPWINSWVNNREAGDFRRHRTHYDVIVMSDEIHRFALGFTATVCLPCSYIIKGNELRGCTNWQCFPVYLNNISSSK